MFIFENRFTGGTVDVLKGEKEKEKEKQLRQNFPVAATDLQLKFCVGSPTGIFKT